MSVQDLENVLLQKLGFVDPPTLLQDTAISWPSGRSIPQVNSVFQVKHVPVAYFSRFAELDLNAIKVLHKKVWSQSKSPLLFVTLPHEIRVYSGYEPPSEDKEAWSSPGNLLLQRLTGLTDVLRVEQEIQAKLIDNKYERIYLETGAFWNTTEGRRIDAKGRADGLLIKGMTQMRDLLTDQELAPHLAFTLLGRSIFIRYLEDRKILTSDWVTEITGGQAGKYLETLPDRKLTFALFEALSQRFNGDLFPVERAEVNVQREHLELLLNFLSGTDLETGQLSLWPFDFEHIPIELISNIYDTFIDERRASGAYYTPLLLADFVLEETLGEDVARPDMAVLDPACGSGIFLVGAYRRLIQAWRKAHGTPDARALSQILQDSIFGVDKEPEATRIAAFSLYLEMLNHLSNAQVQDAAFQFPPLKQRNLIDSDFFDPEVKEHFAGRKFDRVLGNMPWGEGTLTPTAAAWLKEQGHIVGWKQAAPAFMLRVPQFCKTGGELAILAPAKSTILLTSDTHQTFRENFFIRYNVRAVVNFAAMRHELFSEAINPSVAVFYTPNPPAPNRRLIYGVPKPSPLSQRLKAIVLDTTEIKFLDLEELLEHPWLWKTAMWGNPRDAALITRLGTMPTLREQAAKLNWHIGEGIQIKGGDEKPAPWLTGANLIPTKKLRPYLIDMSVCRPIEETVFHRPRVPELVQAPLVLIHKSKCEATFSDNDVAYSDAISGITANETQESLLKWLTAYINSSLARYYHFMTSTTWAVERDNIIQWEYKEMPLLVPDKDNPKLEQILHHFDQIAQLLDRGEAFFVAHHQAELKEHKAVIDQLVFELYDLHPVEQQLVQDVLDYGIDFFNWAKKKTRRPHAAKSVKPPDAKMLKTYADIFTQVSTFMLQTKKKTLIATVYQNGEPLTVVSFDLVDLDKARPVSVIEGPAAMRPKLDQPDNLLLAQKTPSMFVRRHVRVYDGAQVSLIRPSESRFWTQSQARADADAFIAELIA